eukprot:4574766-Prorocentrum_lima.AAC.1
MAKEGQVWNLSVFATGFKEEQKLHSWSSSTHGPGVYSWWQRKQLQDKTIHGQFLSALNTSWFWRRSGTP